MRITFIGGIKMNMLNDGENQALIGKTIVCCRVRLAETEKLHSKISGGGKVA